MSVAPITRAETNAPTTMAYCMYFGVPPTRNPVLSDWATVPPLLHAMHTTAATDSASTRSTELVIPSVRKIRQVTISVAVVIPEIGFDDDPISPVSRADTVTNRNPNIRTSRAP